MTHSFPTRRSSDLGDVGEARGSLVGGNDEIRVVAVMDHDLDGMDDITLDDIVGDREQRADEDSIAFGAFGNPGIAIGGGGKALGVEAAFRAGDRKSTRLNSSH